MLRAEFERTVLALMALGGAVLGACDSADVAESDRAATLAPDDADEHDGAGTSTASPSAASTSDDASVPPASAPASTAPASPPPSTSSAATPPTHFATLGPHASLPAESDCTAWIEAQPTVENVSANTTANHTVPPADWLAAFHANPIYSCGSDLWCKDLEGVTGNFTGSTDMILRWAACKWGVDEDVIRAEAVVESTWRQSQLGDDDDVCHSRNVAAGALNYWSEASPCKPSKGLLQVKLVYFNASPYAATSTAFNVDFTYGSIRACMNGDQSYLKTSTKTVFGSYPPTTTDDALWGCVGRHFSGSWGDSGAAAYVEKVKGIVEKQGWPH